MFTEAEAAEQSCTATLGTLIVPWPGPTTTLEATLRPDPSFESTSTSAPGEHVLLRFTAPPNTRVVAQLPFYSSYGTFEFCYVTLSPRRRPIFLLVTGDRHRTNARRETLAVYELRDAALQPVFATATSGYFGTRARWWYKREFPDLDGDGVSDLRLVLDHDANTSRLNNSSQLPRFSILEYTFNPDTEAFDAFRR